MSRRAAIRWRPPQADADRIGHKAMAPQADTGAEVKTIPRKATGVTGLGERAALRSNAAKERTRRD